MKERVLARRYARALFQIAVERGLLAQIQEEVDSLAEALHRNPDLRTVLRSQQISKTEKKSTLEHVLGDKASKVFLNFLYLLLQKNRERLFEIIASEFDRLVDQHQKRLRANAITAVPLDSEFVGKLKKLLDSTYQAHVDIENQVDPDILGGIIIRVDGQVFDGSLQSQLRRLRAQLVERTNSSVA